MPTSSPSLGHCSQCHKIWTLATQNGVCQWCGKPSTCQTTRTNDSRGIKTSRSRKQRQAPQLGKGYDRVQDQQGWVATTEGFRWRTAHWTTYYNVASRFAGKAITQDREDLLHDLILTLAIAERTNGDKPFTEAVMYRVASYTVADYWFKHYELTAGLDCQHCSKDQRHKCKERWLYSECPKAIKVERLNRPITDGEGNLTELGDLIADDKAIDLDAWLDAKTFLLSCPHRLIQIAQKTQAGINLTPGESRCLYKWRKREQKRLF